MTLSVLVTQYINLDKIQGNDLRIVPHYDIFCSIVCI